MDAELMRIRRNHELSGRMDGNLVRISREELLDKCYKLNVNMTHLFYIGGNPDATIDDYIEKIINNIYIILEMFNEMGIYPDYFYDIVFKINNEYLTLASKGKVDGRRSLYSTIEFPARISKMTENGLNKGNYQLNPTKIKDIGEYYNEMVDFLQKHHLPYEVTTVDMCREMFEYIYHDVNSSINDAFGNSDHISDDVESLSRLLFDYLSFFGAIGINPKRYLDAYINEQKELGKKR